MRHVMLTCKNHPDLRWSCKSLAFTPGAGYNGQRSIFYTGSINPPHSEEHVAECDCSPTELVIAPEDEWGKLSIETQKEAINKDLS